MISKHAHISLVNLFVMMMMVVGIVLVCTVYYFSGYILKSSLNALKDRNKFRD